MSDTKKTSKYAGRASINKVAPKNELWKGFMIVDGVPNTFRWRGKQYDFDTLTANDIAKLAADKLFGHIVAEVAKESATPPASNSK